MKEHIEINNLIPEEQKGCASNSLGCIDQLLIDNMLMCDAKNNQKNIYGLDRLCKSLRLNTAYVDSKMLEDVQIRP